MLRTLAVVAFLAGAAAARAASADVNCTLPAAALHRFKYETFYAWHLADGGNWTNVGQSLSLELLQEFHAATGRPSLLEVQSLFFRPMHDVNASLQGLTIRPDWQEAWANFSTSHVAPMVARGVVTGFMLGDELVWNNITWEQLNATAAAVKASFPDCFVFYNEGGAPLYASRNINHFHAPYPHVPAAVDFVSVDDYQPMSIRKNTEWFYRSFLYPKMLPHHRAWMVPPVFAWINATCDLACWDTLAVTEAAAYLEWAGRDERIVGLDGFHYASYPPHDLGLVSMPRTLACYQALARQLIAVHHRIEASASRP